MANKNWVDELVEFYDFVWQEGTELCGYHVNNQLIEDFAKGGSLFEQMKQKIVEKFPTEKAARESLKKLNGHKNTT